MQTLLAEGVSVDSCHFDCYISQLGIRFDLYPQIDPRIDPEFRRSTANGSDRATTDR